ncbi:hypothetical protein [Micromonospora sp. DH14]|uniref:hypothetical protein n=1 Tax=Micromonospora sp. DH14 TaxID=3040120 RepID=UPI0024428213|nr:hypothetical protein [Micromonospora sp. DH14]MDG9678994.1 hypothetical protein [Micromonospora sp. DH14]
MALAKKGSRLITVDGVVYRWRVRGRPTYAQALGERPLAFAVEQDDCKGSVLLVSMPQDHPSNWIGGPPVPVLPSMVAAVIRKALTEGWRPSQATAAFRTTAPDASQEPSTP